MTSPFAAVEDRTKHWIIHWSDPVSNFLWPYVALCIAK